MHEVALISRRAIAAALPLAAVAGTSVAAPAALPAPSGDCGMANRIDMAAARCRETKEALAAALDAYERALPPPHPTLDMNGRRPPFSSTYERRLFDGHVPNRALDFLGKPSGRCVATEETIENDLNRPGIPVEVARRRRGMLYRMRRRARARAALIGKLEASFRLEELDREVTAAERVLEKLTVMLFEQPATSMAAVLVQAQALSAYAEGVKAGHAAYQAGRLGTQLAIGLQNVARAAA